jgi:M6 family metalloprotease-like protein
MNKKILFIAICLLSLISFSQKSMAIPADPRLRSNVQQGGSVLNYYVIGDEHGHYSVTADGRPIIYNASTRSYEYATVNGQKVVGSGIIAKNAADRSQTDNQQLASLASDKAMSMLVADLRSAIHSDGMRHSVRKTSSDSSTDWGKVNDYPTTGKRHSPVVLIEFADLSFSSMSNPNTYYTNMLNEHNFSENGGTGSAHDYYYDNSNGQFDVTYDVYGPVRLSKPHNYYGTIGSGAADALYDACKQLDGKVDFSQYDSNNDGKVDNIFYFFAGYGEADSGDSNDIWPCSWDLLLAKDTLKCDGKYLSSFACSNEIRYNSDDVVAVPTGIGTFVHEFGHVLGLVDFYDTSYSVLSFTSGYVDLMDKGSYLNDTRTPPYLSGYERATLNWATPRVLDMKADSLITLNKVNANDVIKVKTTNDKESFYLENRQQEGWDKYLPLHGMVEWHVDYDSLAFYTNTANNDYTHPRIDLVEADGQKTLNTRSGDSFPGASNVTECSFTTWNNETLPEHLSYITENNGQIMFYLDGATIDVAAPKDLKAININKRGFTLSWSKVPNALSYDVVVKAAADTITSSTVYDDSLVVTGLTPDTQYSVSVTAIAGKNKSAESLLNVTTVPLDFNERKVIADAATGVTENAFTANWEPMKDATDYELNVNTIDYSATTDDYSYDFAEKADGMPAGWTSSSNVYSSVNGYYGTAAPSLRFSSDNDYLEMSHTDGLISKLTFWYRSAKATGKIFIEKYDKGTWIAIDSISSPATTGTSVSYDCNDAQKVRIRYQRVSGYVCIDDVKTSVRTVTRKPVENYSPLRTGKVTSCKVEGLSKDNVYRYTVTGINASGVKTVPSDEIGVTTTASDSLNIGFCDGELGSKSDMSFDSNNDWGNAAIHLTKETLKPYVGGSIVSLRVGLMSRINLDSLKVWIRSSLDGSNMRESAITNKTSQKISRGWNVLSFGTPYIIKNGEDLYIGYSYKQRNPVAAIAYINEPAPEAFYLKLGSDAQWSDNSAKGALCIEATVVGNTLPKYDLKMKKVSLRYSVDGTMNIDATIRNNASKTVNGFSVKTAISGADEMSINKFDDSLTPGEEKMFSYQVSSSDKGVGTVHPVIVSINGLNEGYTDENESNNSAVADFMYQRNVLVEEFTTEKCSNCPPVAAIVSNVLDKSEYANTVNMVCHHAGFYTDWLTSAADNDLTWFYNNDGSTFAPGMMFDRYAFSNSDNGKATPVLFVNSEEDMQSYINKRLSSGSHVYMNLKAEALGADSLVNVTLSGGRSALFGVSNKITIYVTEDSIVAHSQQGATTSPFYHNHVVRAYNSVWGDDVVWNADNTFSYSYQFVLSKKWKRGNVKIIAMLSSYDENDPGNCEVENCSLVKADDIITTDINGVSDYSNNSEKRYYRTDGVEVNSNRLTPGLYIVKEKGLDGKVITRKVIIK